VSDVMKFTAGQSSKMTDVSCFLIVSQSKWQRSYYVNFVGTLMESVQPIRGVANM